MTGISKLTVAVITPLSIRSPARTARTGIRATLEGARRGKVASRANE